MYPKPYAHLRQRKLWVQTIFLLLLLWAATSVWAVPIITPVDTGGGIDDVGQYSSLEIGPSGNPVMSYYDNSNGDLKIAICTDPTCTTPNILILDAGAILPAGLYTSLELDVTPAGKPVVSYYDVNNGGRLNTVICNDAACSAPTIAFVDDPASFVMGQYASLALRGSIPVTSYYDAAAQDLKISVCADATCTTAVDQIVDNGGGTNDVGRYTSIALNGANPVISYYDQTANMLKLAVCANPACTTSTIQTLSAGGAYSSLALTAAGNPVISYQNGAGTLSVLLCSNPTCSASTSIPVDTVTSTDVSLTLTAAGCPVISYFNSGGGALKIATYNGANCTLVTLTTLDTGGVGEFTSVQLNAAGFPVVSYYDRTNGDLKLVTCDTALCAPLPTYTSVPTAGSTIALTGAAGSSQNANIAVTNTGAAGSELDVAVISSSAGYTITGLPIVDQLVGGAAVNINVSCTVPTAAGTLIVETNEPGNPQYTYNLTCTTPVVVPPTAVPSGSTGGSSSGSSSQVIVFDPAISKLGFLQPGQSGVRGEQIEWMVTVINNGGADGQNIAVTDTLNSDLRIDRVSAPGGTVTRAGQTVTVTYATLAAGQGVQFSIFTTVTTGIDIENTACMTATNLTSQRCSTGRVVRTIPATGETPWLATVVRGGMLMFAAGMSLVGILFSLKRSSKRVDQA